MHKIATIEQMRALETRANAGGISYGEMMELAGQAICNTILTRVTDISERKILVISGPGNNGGDGLVAGRMLAEAGAVVNVYCIRPRDTNDPNLERAHDADVFVTDATNDEGWVVLTKLLEEADVLVDAMLGIGALPPIRGIAAELLQRVSSIVEGSDTLLKVAVDCPSGYNCDTGETDSNLIPSDITVTLGAAKIGQFVFPGADMLGELVLADIGWPLDLDSQEDIKLDLTSAEYVFSLLPSRPRNAHKGTFGTALIIAGSVHYTGAAYLAAAAAYRSGTGLVTLGIPATIYPALAMQLPEATWVLIPSDMGVIAENGVDVLAGALKRSMALLVGPGLGTERTTRCFLQKLLQEEREVRRSRMGFAASRPQHRESEQDKVSSLPPLVLDADGLKALAEIDGWPDILPPRSVLTPHPGEMAVLTGLKISEIQSDRPAIALRYAHEWGHVIVLKGAFTIVASPDGRAAINPFATAALASAGTGDVLAGLITGFVAQGLDPYDAAVAGAYVHGLSGELAANAMGTDSGVLAGDVLHLIPKAMATMV